MRQRENVDEVACSCQGGVAKHEANLGLDCDEDSAGVEQIEEGSRSAVGPGTHGSQELTVGWVAVGMECAEDEETLGPFRTAVAARWSRVDGAQRAEHIASAKKTWAAEE